jgi:hypothetical protein
MLNPFSRKGAAIGTLIAATFGSGCTETANLPGRSNIVQRTPWVEDLGTLGGSSAQALGQSADCKIVVGCSSVVGSKIRHLFRWTRETGMVDKGEFSIEVLAELLKEAPGPRHTISPSGGFARELELQGYREVEFLSTRTPSAGTVLFNGETRAVIVSLRNIPVY